LHGVLNDPAMAEHSFFYFRDPAYLATLPAAQRARFVDDTAAAKTKLLALKEQIRHASRDGKLKYAPRENYADPKALAELVRKDSGEVIDRLFPEGSESDTLTREAAEHEAWARSRQRVYVAREAYFRRLDEHAAGDGPPLVVLGESGSGKTALLAYWVKRLRERADAPFVIQHYIGASSGSTPIRTTLSTTAPIPRGETHGPIPRCRSAWNRDDPLSTAEKSAVVTRAWQRRPHLSAPLDRRVLLRGHGRSYWSMLLSFGPEALHVVEPLLLGWSWRQVPRGAGIGVGSERPADWRPIVADEKVSSGFGPEALHVIEPLLQGWSWRQVPRGAGVGVGSEPASNLPPRAAGGRSDKFDCSALHVFEPSL